MVGPSFFTHVADLIRGGGPVLLVVPWAVLWVCILVEVLTIREDEFPGPHARLCWFIGLLVVPEVTPIAYIWWRIPARLERRRRLRALGK